MTNFPSPNEALQAIEAELARAIGATPLAVHIRQVHAWDGDGRDIAYEFRCSWRRWNGDKTATFGAHSGTVRATDRYEDGATTCGLYGGHYDCTIVEASEEARRHTDDHVTLVWAVDRWTPARLR